MAEAIELQKGFERRLELLREGSFLVGNEVHDKVLKLGGELVAMKKASSAADDTITALTMVMKNSIEKERVEWEKTDNDNKTELNKTKQEELTEERDASENEPDRNKVEPKHQTQRFVLLDLLKYIRLLSVDLNQEARKEDNESTRLLMNGRCFSAEDLVCGNSYD